MVSEDVDVEAVGEVRIYKYVSVRDVDGAAEIHEEIGRCEW